MDPRSVEEISCDDRNITHQHNEAHHIHEFGHVPNVVHIPRQSDATADQDNDPVAPINDKTRLARQFRWKRLRSNLFHERHLMQFFYNETLYRSRESRKVCREELFLDLVIVAAIAALGHELRAVPISWPAVEKFILLFFALYSAWRHVVALWNNWGVKEDLFEKAGIYVSFVCITGIALGAHEAFSDGVRPYVSASAFLATLIPAIGSAVMSLREKLLRSLHVRGNHIFLASICAVISVIPYFIAIFVSSSSTARILFWITNALILVVNLAPFLFYRLVGQNVKGYIRLAINIELLVEKYEVLTMIVLGESVIGLLFEAGAVISKDGIRVGHLYLAAVGSTALLYSLQTFYIHVDNPILKGGQHGLRHNAIAGICWDFVHTPYHLGLILFATGLGFALRDIAIPPSAAKEAAKMMIRAGDSGAALAGKESFTREARWVFVAGWGASLLSSGVMSMMHKGGPRAATKTRRLITRFVIVIALMVGLPFADLSAGRFLTVFTVVTVALGIAEFILVRMDRIGFFRSEGSISSTSNSAGKSSDPELVVTDDSDNDDGGHDTNSNMAMNELDNMNSSDEAVIQHVKARLCKGHCARIVVVKPRRRATKSNEMLDNS